MPTTDVRIINQALSHLGHTIFIDSRDEDTNEVAVSDVHYDDALAYVLEDFAWGFAHRYVTPGLVEDFTLVATVHDWDYSYRYPVDTAKIRRIVTSLGLRETTPPPFVIGSDDSGRLIYTNTVEAIVSTTALITDPALFPAMFAEALAWWLAFLMVPGLAKDKGVAGQCFAMYDRIMMRAASSAGNESQHDPDEDSEAIRARL